MNWTEFTQLMGTVPQWGLLAAVIIALIRLVPTWRAQSLKKRKDDIDGWRDECEKLRAELERCEAQCRKEIGDLHDEIFGLRKQHIQEQISLINVILQSVDAPELKTLLKMLESVQITLQAQRAAHREHKEEGATS